MRVMNVNVEDEAARSPWEHAGWPKLAAIVTVLLVVGALTFSQQKRDVVDDRTLILDDGLSSLHRAIEKEVLESTGLRVEVVEPAEVFGNLFAESERHVAGDATYTFSQRDICSVETTVSHCLSSLNGNGNKIKSETSKNSRTEWNIEYTTSSAGGYVKLRSDDLSGKCIKVNSNHEVRMDGCGVNNARLVLLRFDPTENPSNNYDANEFMFYAYKSSRKFIVVDNDGDVSASNDPRVNGIWAITS